MTTLAPEKPAAIAARVPAKAVWLLVLGIVLAALNLRTAVTSVGPLLGDVRGTLGLSGLLTGLLTALPVICFAVFGAFTPALARRIGEHRLLLLALVTLSAGLAVRVMIDSAAFFLVASTVALAGGAVGNVLIPSLVKRHFPTRVGLMTTVYATALAVGTMIAAAATIPIERAAGGDWHLALGSWAALAAVAVIPWLALRGREPGRTAEAGGHTPISSLLRSRLGWAMAGYFGSQSLVAYVMFGWLAQILLDGGYTAADAGLTLAVFTGLSVPISALIPALAARLADQRVLVVVLIAFYAVGFAGLLLDPSWIWAMFVGVGMGSFPLALTLFALRSRTASATAALSAFGQSAGYLIAGLGPLLVGVLYTATGGWTAPFALLFGAIAIQLLTGLYVGGRRYLEDETARAT
ncbi:MFS transporter [Rhizohabitans arisaemae]|uniref:MFS transporter n=1 Tax=Rhizohabitans arisaemae TaxID=2720610 RepID=UPI0024B19F82|nr:MFS transporter [Rhizohabitans arisaemae]